MPDAQVVPRARRLIQSGLFDEEFYTALRGREFDTTQSAAEDCVALGMPMRLSPHPFLDFTTMPPDVRRAWRRGRVGSVLDYLSSPAGQSRPTGPLHRPEDVDAPTYAAHRAELVAHARAVGSSVASPAPGVVDWTRLTEELPDRVEGRVSVVIPTFGDAWMTLRATRSALEHAGAREVEVAVVDNGSPAHIALALAGALRDMGGARLVRIPANRNFAGGTNMGIAHTTGDLILLLNNDTVVRRGWLEPLLGALADPGVAGVQPLLLFEDDTIQTAGTVFVGDDLLPCQLLTGHPPEDGNRVRGESFAAVTAAALLMRATDLVELRGFDEGFVNGFEDVDLCLRALDLRPGGFRVAPDSRVTHLESKTPGRYAQLVDNRVRFVERWRHRMPTADPGVYARLGFVAAIESDGKPMPVAQARVTALVDGAARRWGFSIPSTAGSWGDDWGDTHFAEALARALRGLGEDVVIRRNGAHQAGPTHLDDAHLALRGRDPILPRPGVINVLWVISHPESVDPDELEGYDLVFAASQPWSTEMSQRSGREVIPMLQATEITPASIAAALPQRVEEAVFVGNTEGRSRPLVHWAIEAGIPLAVYGRGWEGLLPSGVWRPGYIAPGELPELYRRHGLVLADHWPDMARHGFVANRLFDALASGATVATDDVQGIAETIPHGSLEVVTSADDLAVMWLRLKNNPPRSNGDVPPGLDFGSRARVLIDAVIPLFEKVEPSQEP